MCLKHDAQTTDYEDKLTVYSEGVFYESWTISVTVTVDSSRVVRKRARDSRNS